MQESAVLYGPGHEPGGSGTLFTWLAVVVAATGGWAIDRYAVTLGLWRLIPVVLLFLFAFVAGMIASLSMLVADGSNLLLTDTHLILRGRVRRRRWAWTDLREIRIIEVEQGAAAEPPEKVDILTLVPVRGPMVTLPEPFRRTISPDPDPDPDPESESESDPEADAEPWLESIADRLNASLRLNHPLAEPVESAELECATTQLRESMETAHRRSARHDKFWNVASVIAVLVFLAFTAFRATAKSTHWGALNYGALVVACGNIGMFAMLRWSKRPYTPWRYGFVAAGLAVGIVISLVIAKLR